jgi:hypothetical protein
MPRKENLEKIWISVSFIEFFLSCNLEEAQGTPLGSTKTRWRCDQTTLVGEEVSISPTFYVQLLRT